MQRAEVNGNGFPAGRMLMEPGFDATDAIGSVSERSTRSDSTLSRGKIAKLTTTMDKMQIEPKVEKSDNKSSLTEIREVPSTSPAISVKNVRQPTVEKVDENANYCAQNEVKKAEKPKSHVVLTPPPKKQKHFNPSVKCIQNQMKVVIVHVEDSQTIYVIPHNELDYWKRFIDSTNKYAEIAKNLEKPPENGFIILAKPKNCDSYSRGLVKKIRSQDRIAKVEFLEHGFTDVVKFSDMKCASEELVNTPRLVNQLSLKGPPNDPKNCNAIVQFLQSLQESEAELIVKNLELIEKTSVCAHFNGILVETEKFTVINDRIKHLVTEDAPPPNIEMEDISEPKDLSDQKKKVSIRRKKSIVAI